MPSGLKRRRSLSVSAVALTLMATLGLAVGTARAAGPPVIGSVWASSVFSSSARLSAQINPNGLASSYHFDYIAKAAYDANVAAAKDPFNGTQRTPATDANIGAGTVAVTALQQIPLLSADTVYRYRVVAKNSTTVISPTFTFVTQITGGTSLLADSRGWEMVSPVDKNGGQIDAPGALAGGGVLQAAAGGGAVTYGSAASFGTGAQGAPPASQYISSRAAAGWSTQNITVPIFSGSYGAPDEGVPYQLFSGDLGRGLLLNGDHCRGGGSGCAVPNPPLAGTDAPAGYQDYYLRDSATAGFAALLGAANTGFLGLDPAAFDLRFAGASPDLLHSVLSTCAALTSNATEVPLGPGCDPARANLYEYSPGAGLTLVNLLPAQTTGTPGAALAAQSGSVSANGARVYWTDLATGNLYLREAGQSKQVDDDAGGGGSFQTASDDGSVAFYTKGEHLWRYEAASGNSTDLTPSGGVTGVLGASAGGDYLYYLTTAGLFLRHGATGTKVADAADSVNYPPTTGSARVSADGTHLLFVSSASLTGYDNTDLKSGSPDAEAFLYDAAGSGTLTCVSCNPTNGRPIGPSSVPGATANGSAAGSTQSYKPRALSADGRRVFFNSRDALVLADTNNDTDVYEWEPQGVGSCVRSGGCVSLISSGRAASPSTFVDASADGSDAFFLTDASLVGSDPGALDLYDARVGGGFPVPQQPIPCEGDNCQSLPSAPADPTLTTLLIGPGNPAVRYPKTGKRCKKGSVKRKGKCVSRKKRDEKSSKKTSHKKRSGR